MNDIPIDFETPVGHSTYETANYERSTKSTDWQAVRDECRSGGALTDDCDLIAASKGTGELKVVAKRLSCGCILIPEDSDEVLL